MTSHVHTASVISIVNGSAAAARKVKVAEIAELIPAARTAEEYWTAVRNSVEIAGVRSVSLQIAGHFHTTDEADGNKEQTRRLTRALSEHDFVTFAIGIQDAEIEGDLEQLIRALRASIQAKLRRA